METNVGVLDGAARLIAGAVLMAMSYGEFGVVWVSLSWIAWCLGCFLLFTGLFHHCFVYRIFGINSCAYGPEPFGEDK